MEVKIKLIIIATLIIFAFISTSVVYSETQLIEERVLEGNLNVATGVGGDETERAFLI